MKRIIQLISFIGLVLTIVPPILFFKGTISHSSQNLYMLAGAVIWFVTAYFWLGRKWKKSR